MNKKVLIIYPDFFDATTASFRLLSALKLSFKDIEYCYWARTGKPRISNDVIYENIKFNVFDKTAPPLSFKVLLLTLYFQYWVLKNILKIKPDVIISVTFLSFLPALFYRIFFNCKCKIIYDPRDYIGVSYFAPKIIKFTLTLFDSIFVRLSNMVIFPDNQYFEYYGKIRIKESKCFILPNSTDDKILLLRKQSTHERYNIEENKIIIPYIGYFADSRGKKALFEFIDMNLPFYHFIIAGDIRDKTYLDFFKSKRNVSFLGRISFIESLSIMRDCEIIPLLYDPELLNNKYAYPTKFFDALMVGRPVISSASQVNLSKEVIENKLGKVIEYNNTDELVQVFENIRLNIKSYDRLIIRQEFDKYNFDNYKLKLNNKITEIL